MLSNTSVTCCSNDFKFSEIKKIIEIKLKFANFYKKIYLKS